ncbi:hypothetical protein [Dyella sp. Tek66A03]|uniref:hypothetical protein n=1 Tax=Dyella sp. Tek66A03 TaxID=3458298 RepID=UPI00403E7F5C
MIMTIDQLKQVLASGGNLMLDGTSMTLSQIKDLASQAKPSGAKITIKRVGDYTPVQLEQVAALAPGLITFDLTS